MQLHALNKEKSGKNLNLTDSGNFCFYFKSYGEAGVPGREISIEIDLGLAVPQKLGPGLVRSSRLDRAPMYV